ncbi:RNA polymerase subunit sigma [Metasolibacillus sp. FSL H7-0170]|uniref:RNA polymerase subunit sigma n=1 Tax=Metasolibacillus TaxID=2703677 RepID=UPI000794FF21|nr:RNA polymerase subunit sigma [Metasolibacillus fluoroglycofenilyticus]KYG89532.1 RNA polymerase subunit sigma [[Bacillus] sp. KCTC 13219]
MSLKGVELQIAIPKTFDAGKMADQQHQNNILQQMHANEALKKELERKQKTVNDTENLDAISDEESHNEANAEQQKKKKQTKEEKEKAHHPFKGNFIDYSG